MTSQPNIDPGLLLIAGERYAAELLDALASRPMTRAELRAHLCAPRGELADVLRGLASLGAIRRAGHNGTWDVLAPAGVPYELTSAGVEWATQLRRLDVWVAIYERGFGDEA